MKTKICCTALGIAGLLGVVCVSNGQESFRTAAPAPLEMQKAEQEVEQRYAAAHPEIQEYVLWTARSFGRGGMWLNEDAFADLPPRKPKS